MKDTIGHLRKDDGSFTESNNEAATILNSCFKSNFVTEESTVLLNFTTRIHDSISDIDLNISTIYHKLSALNPNKTPGPDGIHSYVLKMCSASLSEPLYLLFKQSLTTGTLPRDWKTANVTPIYKKGVKSDPNNYRPISLTSQVVKVLESLLRDDILKFLLNHRALSEHQHGFLFGRSCLTNLLESLDDWSSILDTGNAVDIVFLDLHKAFDSVPHRRLLMKLSAYGIQGKIATWLSEFLGGKLQRVVLNQATSGWTPVISGVPQGSVLGPLLFLLYVNDIPDLVQSNLKMFADDIKIYRSIYSTFDSLLLQQDLDKLSEWTQKWLIRFSVPKCVVLTLNNSRPTNYTMTDASDVQRSLVQVSQVRDLGVRLTNSLTPTLQCQKAANKAMQVMEMIRRSFKYLTKESFLLLYKSLIRPHLEYCIPCWSPYLAKDIDLLEKIQHRATKLVSDILSLAYTDHLRCLGLHSLYCRRQRGDLIEAFKIINNLSDSSLTFPVLSGARTRGHTKRIFVNYSRLNLRKYFFMNRVVQMWNKLLDDVVQASTISVFKARLDSYWLEIGYGHCERPMA